MTGPYGVTAAGFVRKPLEVILRDIEDRQRSTIDSALDVSADQPLGKMNAIAADPIDELWRLAPTDCFVAAPTGKVLLEVPSADRVTVYRMPEFLHWSRYGFAPADIVKQFPTSHSESHSIHVGPSGVFTDLVEIFGEDHRPADTLATLMHPALVKIAAGDGKVARFIAHGMLRGPNNPSLVATWYAKLCDQNGEIAKLLRSNLSSLPSTHDGIDPDVAATWIPPWEREKAGAA